MPFQSTIFLQQGFGVPGELFNNGPYRAQSFILRSVDHPEYNKIGATAYTVVSEGVAEAGGTGPFAGILANPKVAPLNGTLAEGTLAPTLTLPNESQADMIDMGTMNVTLPAAAAIGDYVVYDNTTGALSTIIPGATLPAGTGFAQAVVSYFTVAGAGMAVITLDPTLITPGPTP